MDVNDMAKHLEQMGANLAREMLQAERDNVALAKAAMMKHSSGTNKSRGRKPILPINIQSGEFIKSFALTEPHYKGNEIEAEIWNEAPHAKFLEKGTRFMDARPLRETTLNEIAAEVEDNRLKAIERASK